MGVLVQGANSTFVAEWVDGHTIASLQDEVAGWRILRHAVAYYDIADVEEVLPEGSIHDSFGPYEEHLVHWAAWHGRPDVLSLLVGLGADIDAGDIDGATPLLFAAQVGQREVFQEALALGADASRQNVGGVTLLHVAATGGDPTIIQESVALGLDVDARTRNGNTPLMRAQTTEAALALLSAGASINARNQEGWTALHNAAYRHADLVAALVSHGADVHARTTIGLTPLMAVVNAGDLEAVDVLLEAGARVNDSTLDGNSTPLALAVSHGHLDVVARLSEAGADWHFRNDLGTLLHAASKGRNTTVELLQLIVDAGVPLEATDVLGNTALHEAASRGNIAAIGFLLDEGASGAARNLLGRTPYESALAMISVYPHLQDSEELWRLHDATFE